jgi:hypothetical protein
MSQPKHGDKGIDLVPFAIYILTLEIKCIMIYKLTSKNKTIGAAL